ncbi:hypothetical protein R3W88_029158 [Solanum pinnatisectum]|uniref:KIB1-4 beta-propeller domain-containing protein n=1 Tax=Solanum pinnatisectum TaxID=50273 RepID=A0AAV9K4K2_9SOLN|nr:hypothetical protein R3W88_029158 [Solanum pinnatisectum]
MYDLSLFNETNVSSTVEIFNEWGSKKRLVESGGELFMVDMFLDTDVKTELHGSQPSWKSPKEIKIYRLDEEQHEWIRFYCKGLHGQHTGIITLQDGKLGSLLSFLEYADILWPPSSWLYTGDRAGFMMEAMCRESKMASWSDLPKELVEEISKCIDTHIDILRIRALCNLCRSAIPPNFKIPKLNFPNNMTEGYHEKSKFYLIECTVYLFQLPHPPHTGWFVKVVETPDGKLQILNPLTNRVIKFVSDDKRLNLLDLRNSLVSKSYHVQRVLTLNHKSVWRFINKILLIWNDQNNHFSLMAITVQDHLLCFKSEDENWTTLKDASSKIVDISVYKGNFYAVDTYGETIMYDPVLFNQTNVSSTVKILYSSLFNEWLFLVDMFLDTDIKTELQDSEPKWKSPKEIKIYRLDEEQHEWIAVHTLGDQSFFAGDDCCFSVSSSDFGDQCRGNCIYYVNGGIIVDMGVLPPKYYHDDFKDYLVCGDYSFVYADNDDKIDLGSESSGGLSEELKLRYKELYGHHTGIFTLQDGKLGSLSSFLEYADIFWPPPSWLLTDDQAASEKVFASDHCIYSFVRQVTCFLRDGA